MLKLNHLFGLIKHQLNTDPMLPQNEKFQIKRNLGGKNYALHHLAVDSLALATELGNLTLHSHHLSIYEYESETQDESKAHLSEYHYTAYFNDQNKNIYRLHVYFDKNYCFRGHNFSLRNETGNYQSQKIQTVLKSLLIQLAIDHSQDFMIELRQQWQLTRLAEEQRFKTIEIQLCKLTEKLVDKGSVHYNINQELYITQLNEALASLKILASLDTDYISIFNLLKHISTQSQQVPFVEKTINTKMNSIAESENTKEIENNEAAIANEKLMEDLKNKQVFELEMKNLREVREKYKGVTINKNADAKAQASLHDLTICFAEFDHQLNVQLALVDDHHQFYEIDSLRELQTYIAERTAAAKSLITRLIVSDQFELAKYLKNYFNLLPSSCLQYAIKINNALLLNFLLQNGHFSVNTDLVDHQTLAQFCFFQHSEKNPKSACLSVLIKHGASLMVKMADGLPLAHHILSDSDNSLQKALIENSGLKISGKGLYKGLASSLRTYLKTQKLDELKKQKLELTLLNYENGELTKSVSNRFAKIEIQETLDRLKQIFGETTIQLASNDETLQAKLKEIMILQNENLARLAPDQKRKMQVRNKRLLKNIDLLLNTGSELDVNNESVMEHYDNLLLLCQEYKNYLNIEDDIRSKYGNKRKKQEKRAKIVDKIANLAQHYNFITDIDESKLTEIKDENTLVRLIETARGGTEEDLENLFDFLFERSVPEPAKSGATTMRRCKIGAFDISFKDNIQNNEPSTIIELLDELVPNLKNSDADHRLRMDTKKLLIEGMHYHDQKNYNKALAHFSKVLKLSYPQNDEILKLCITLAYLKRAGSYSILKKYEDALNDINRYFADSPLILSIAYSLRALILFELTRFTEAAEVYTFILKEYGESEESYALRACCYFELMQLTEARSDYENAQKFNSNNENYLQVLAAIDNILNFSNSNSSLSNFSGLQYSQNQNTMFNANKMLINGKVKPSETQTAEDDELDQLLENTPDFLEFSERGRGSFSLK